MRLPRTLVTSRVGRRMLSLFILCALVPMTVMAIVSFVQMNRLIGENESRGLHRDAFLQAMAVYDRMVFLDRELEILSLHLPEGRTREGAPFLYREDDLSSFHFLSLAVWDPGDAAPRLVFGRPPERPLPAGNLLQTLPSGKAAVLTGRREDGFPAVFLLRLTSSHPDRRCLVAEINPEYLLGVHDRGEEAETVKLSVLEEGRLIFTNLPPDHGPHLLNALNGEGSNPRGVSWSAGDERYLSSYAHIFLKGRFAAPLWTLVLSEPVELMRAPATMFLNAFVPALLIALCLVLLVSARQIRKSLIPLEKLKESTRKISRGELVDHEVIESGDEFQDLSESFNAMAEKLDQQFNTLKTMASIDRSILSLIDSDRIVETFLSRIGSILPSDVAGVYVQGGGGSHAWNLHARGAGKPGSRSREVVRIPESDLEPLRMYNEYIVFRQGDRISPYLRRLSWQDLKMFIVLPIMVKGELHAFIVLAERTDHAYPSDYIIHARQVADHMAVAFANASLIDELNQLNWGTLTALARVVDAKSPWTAGHSERVAELAVRVGREAGLTEKEIVNLNKAGLLHDIGKIRTPRAILDKPGNLTEEEIDIIRRHPEDSSRILEPITPYKGIIPAVLQHHERFDGRGYPRGIAGEDISILGRILAIADSYDAMVSDRPYRKGKSEEEALKEIQREAGKQFDPEVVKALMRVVSLKRNEEGRA